MVSASTLNLEKPLSQIEGETSSKVPNRNNGKKPEVDFTPTTQTEWLLNRLFPPKERVLFKQELREYDTNSILYANVLIYGDQNSGKSELMRALAEKAVERYGEDEVNAVNVHQDVNLALDKAIADCPYNFLYLDDMTCVKVGDEPINQYFQIRHIMKRKTGRSQGLIVTFLACHDFFQLQKQFRTNFKCLIAKSAPANRFDRNHLAGYIGEEGIALLTKFEDQRWIDQDKYGSAIFSWGLRAAVMDLPMATRDYLLNLKPTVTSTTQWPSQPAHIRSSEWPPQPEYPQRFDPYTGLPLAQQEYGQAHLMTYGEVYPSQPRRRKPRNPRSFNSNRNSRRPSSYYPQHYSRWPGWS